MVLNALLALIKQFGIQLLEIVNHVKEERYLLQEFVTALKISNFGIKLIASNVWFLNFSISLFLNVYSAQIDRYMTLLLQNASIAQNQNLILTEASVLHVI
jgi:hypothetical protein